MTNLEQIKKGIQIDKEINEGWERGDPRCDLNIPQVASLFFDEFYVPLRKALKENDQEVIEYFKTAPDDERLMAYTAVRNTVDDKFAEGVITETGCGEYLEMMNLYSRVSKDYEGWKNEHNKSK